MRGIRGGGAAAAQCRLSRVITVLQTQAKFGLRAISPAPSSIIDQDLARESDALSLSMVGLRVHHHHPRRFQRHQSSIKI